jgi:hypothetical protein
MRAGGTDGCDRSARAWPEQRVLGDQRPVEVAGKRRDPAREGRR